MSEFRRDLLRKMASTRKRSSARGYGSETIMNRRIVRNIALSRLLTVLFFLSLTPLSNDEVAVIDTRSNA